MPICSPTEAHEEGPFYRPGAPDATDLYPSNSTAPILWFTGSVSDTNCQPLPETVIEVWQADEYGHYDNQEPNALLTEFRCRGRMTTDALGLFAFRTLLPVNYPVPGKTSMRVKHIHFKLFAHSGQSLTTEIELLPDEYAASDELYNPNLAATLQKKENSNTGIPEYSVHFDFLLSLASPSKSGV